MGDRWGDSKADRDALDNWITREDADMNEELREEVALETLLVSLGMLEQIAKDAGDAASLADAPFIRGSATAYGWVADELGRALRIYRTSVSGQSVEEAVADAAVDELREEMAHRCRID